MGDRIWQLRNNYDSMVLTEMQAALSSRTQRTQSLVRFDEGSERPMDQLSDCALSTPFPSSKAGQ